MSLEAEAEACASVGLVRGQARDLVHARKPIPDRVAVQAQSIGRLGRRAVMGEEWLERADQVGVVPCVVLDQGRDCPCPQLRELVGISKEYPDQEPVSLILL